MYITGDKAHDETAWSLGLNKTVTVPSQPRELLLLDITTWEIWWLVLKCEVGCFSVWCSLKARLWMLDNFCFPLQQIRNRRIRIDLADQHQGKCCWYCCCCCCCCCCGCCCCTHHFSFGLTLAWEQESCNVILMFRCPAVLTNIYIKNKIWIIECDCPSCFTFSLFCPMSQQRVYISF